MSSSAAQAAVGQDDATTDWQLQPELHAAALGAECGALKRVLQRDEIKNIVERFRRADRAALRAQARYKRIGHLSLYSAALATVVGALFVMPLESWLTDLPASIASGLQILALATAFLTSRILAVSSPFATWMRMRAEAELARVELFDTLAKAEEPVREGELPLLPLKLEYFRRYQLDVQRRYYSGRGAAHKKAAWRNNRWLTTSMLFTVAAVLVGGFIALNLAAAWGLPLPEWIMTWVAPFGGPRTKRVVLGLATMASALYGLGMARTLMNLDERNASRFLTTAGNLEFLRDAGLSTARAAANEGKLQEVFEFIRSIQDQISSEHREWISLGAREHDPDRLLHARRR